MLYSKVSFTKLKDYLVMELWTLDTSQYIYSFFTFSMTFLAANLPKKKKKNPNCLLWFDYLVVFCHMHLGDELCKPALLYLPREQESNFFWVVLTSTYHYNWIGFLVLLLLNLLSFGNLLSKLWILTIYALSKLLQYLPFCFGSIKLRIWISEDFVWGFELHSEIFLIGYGIFHLYLRRS